MSVGGNARRLDCGRTRPQRNDAVMRMPKFDRSAAPFQGLRGSLENPYQLCALLTACERGLAVPNAIKEVLAFGLQRFLLFDVGRIHVAVVIGVVEVGEGVVMRRPLHANVKNPDFLERCHVVL